jgi:hypothetical protein
MQPALALKRGDLLGVLTDSLRAKIGADARGLSAITMVLGTFGDECLNDHHSVVTG